MIGQRVLALTTLALLGQACLGEPAETNEDETGGVESDSNDPAGESINLEPSFDKSLASAPGPFTAPNTVEGVEAQAQLTQHYGVQGVGARVADGAVTTIRLVGRKFEANGSLGGLTFAYGGSSPYTNPEAWCAFSGALQGSSDVFMTGISGRISGGNMVMLTISGRHYDPVSRELYGNPVVVQCGSQPSSSAERSIDTTAAGDGWWPYVITGVGMRELSDNLDRLRIWLGDPV